MTFHMDVKESIPAHAMDKYDVLDILQTSSKGLSEREAQERLEFYGPNALEEGEKETIFDIFIDQFKDVLVIILIFAALISGVVLHEFKDAVLITIILIINAIFGVYEEWRADKALEALREMVAHTCKVIRDGEEKIIHSSELVPGDIIALEMGDRVPADGRLIEANNLRTEEAQLTGESTEVNKSSVMIVEKTAPIGDRINMVFMGTHVTYGKGKAVITTTGMNTEMGQIAGAVQEIQKDPTPTQIKLDEFGKRLGFIILALMGFMIAFGTLARGIDLFLMFQTGVSLAVAAIPEGLPIVITLALALGVQRMAKQNAIVKKLPAVESLGSVTTICTDKTGTLTKNEMTVLKIAYFTPDGFIVADPNEVSDIIHVDEESHPHTKTLQLMFKAAVLCNNAKVTEEKAHGDPTEVAFLRLAKEMNVPMDYLYKKYQRIDEIPFDSERKRMTVVVEDKDGNRTAFMKGAPEIVLSLAKKIDRGNGPEPLTEEMKQEIINAINNMTEKALRVLAFAYYELEDVAYNVYEFENSMVINGLMGMIDPAKPGVKEAVEACHTAGIHVVMVTGDHKNTAYAIGKEIGICSREDQVLTGQELDEMTDYELTHRINDISVFARISPQHKLKIVRSLKKHGEIVAMTGDGVNDAPALKGADIGIAMGSGTDVTKETADMILEDDNFTTIVQAIEEGRGIYDNMTKFIRYMLSSNLAEIVVIFFAILMNVPPPLIPVQILWVNLVTDGLPALALGVDPIDHDLMKRKPRDPNENLLNKERSFLIIQYGMYISILTLGVYFWFYPQDLVLGRTMAFAMLSIAQLFNSFLLRTEKQSLLGKRFFSNKSLIWATLISGFAQFFVIQGDWFISVFRGEETHLISHLFGTTPLDAYHWGIIMGLSFSLILFSELLKLIQRHIPSKESSTL